MEPSLTVSLYGTKGEAENLELKLYELIALCEGEAPYCDLHLAGDARLFCNSHATGNG